MVWPLFQNRIFFFRVFFFFFFSKMYISVFMSTFFEPTFYWKNPLEKWFFKFWSRDCFRETKNRLLAAILNHPICNIRRYAFVLFFRFVLFCLFVFVFCLFVCRLFVCLFVCVLHYWKGGKITRKHIDLVLNLQISKLITKSRKLNLLQERENKPFDAVHFESLTRP